MYKKKFKSFNNLAIKSKIFYQIRLGSSSRDKHFIQRNSSALLFAYIDRVLYTLTKNFALRLSDQHHHREGYKDWSLWLLC